jgi:hypothetical protein
VIADHDALPGLSRKNEQAHQFAGDGGSPPSPAPPRTPTRFPGMPSAA